MTKRPLYGIQIVATMMAVVHIIEDNINKFSLAGITCCAIAIYNTLVELEILK